MPTFDEEIKKFSEQNLNNLPELNSVSKVEIIDHVFSSEGSSDEGSASAIPDENQNLLGKIGHAISNFLHHS